MLVSIVIPTLLREINSASASRSRRQDEESDEEDMNSDDDYGSNQEEEEYEELVRIVYSTLYPALFRSHTFPWFRPSHCLTCKSTNGSIRSWTALHILLPIRHQEIDPEDAHTLSTYLSSNPRPSGQTLADVILQKLEAGAAEDAEDQGGKQGVRFEDVGDGMDPAAGLPEKVVLAYTR